MGGQPITCPSFKAFANQLERWRLQRLENGLRVFEEEDVPRIRSALPPGCKAVGLVFSRPALIFKLVMDLGKSRCHWDLTFDSGAVIKHIDENTDVIQVTFRQQCTRQTFCLTRRWSYEADGSYVVLLSSTERPEERPGGATQGKLFGGWIISPFRSTNAPTHETPSACLVTNVMRLQRKGWMEWLLVTGGGMPLAQRVVIAQVAGLRELCEHTSDTWQLEEKVFGNSTVLNVHEKTDDNDSFYEPASEGSDDEGYAIELDPAHRNADAEDCALLSGELGSSGVAGFSENGGNAQIGKNAPEVGNLEKGKWPQEAGVKSTNCWCEPNSDYFRVRGINYLRDRKKVSAGKPFADLVAVDWFVDHQRIDKCCSRPTGTCQRKILSGPNADQRFVFAVNIQVPGARHYSIVYYYLLNEPLDPNSLFGRFVHGTDNFRNARFKLIPHVALGPWVVQRAVGTKPLIVGKALKVAYHQSPNYLEVDIDIGSSTVANNVVRFVLGYVRGLVVDMCFLVEGQADEELPERLIGTSRVAHLEMESAIPPPPLE